MTLGDGKGRPHHEDGPSNPNTAQPTRSLTPEHRSDLHESAITDEVIDGLGLWSVPGKGWVLPWSDGVERIDVGIPDRDKRRTDRTGKVIKVEWPAGQTTFLNALREPTGGRRWLLQEGVRQSLAATSWAPAEFGVLGMNGCNGLHAGIADRLGWVEGAEVWLSLDADVDTSPRVRQAARDVSRLLRDAGAASVRTVRVRDMWRDTSRGNRGTVPDTLGLDDLLAGTAPGQRADVLAELLEGAPEAPLSVPNLPDSFWASRGSLGHVRDAAHSRGRSADLVLGAVLARVSAMVSPRLRFRTCLGDGALNLFVAAVGPSGTGKSTAVRLAGELAPPPAYLNAATFRDGLGLGSGEGLAEAYYGYVQQETGETYQSGERKGQAKTAQVRAKVRDNALIYVDEGQTFTAMIERAGATIGPALRSAWSGETLGQANAREETTRVVPAGSYALGLVIGYQPDTAQALLADTGPGTPQRFLWLRATDPAIPRRPPAHPGPLALPLTEPTANPFATPEPARPLTGDITFSDEIDRRLWDENHARATGEVEAAPFDSHRPQMHAKVAALLALLDGRTKVDEEDWRLARLVLEVSDVVRDQLVDHGAQQQRRAEEARTEAHVTRQVRTKLAVDAVDADVARVAAALARKVRDKGLQTHGAARQLLASRDRTYFDAAVRHAVSLGWLGDDGSAIAAGASAPTG